MIICEELSVIKRKVLIVCEELSVLKIKPLIVCKELDMLKINVLIVCKELNALKMKVLRQAYQKEADFTRKILYLNLFKGPLCGKESRFSAIFMSSICIEAAEEN
ncbi:hypothetical protein KY290_036269 [Solanum tuberosum]|uniref:Uncharacterized protein n=1 Tax=Solanum tuberosum TaxID=4113 RepID=A0ABQ7TTI8_SOLTU|nr:hypothetical protein KY290_036269 [Solanum tuberosum]